jgi:tetratricopeptide (TPR) repeat protein
MTDLCEDSKMPQFVLGFIFLACIAAPSLSIAQDGYQELFQKAVSASNRNQFDEALSLLEQARQIACEPSGVKNEFRCHDVLYEIGVAYGMKGDKPQALPYLRKGYEYRVKDLGQYHWRTLIACGDLGYALTETDQASEAINILTPCIEEKNDLDVLTQAKAYLSMATALGMQRKFVDGEAVIRKFMAKLERRSLYESTEYFESLEMLAMHLQKIDRGARLREAEAVFRKALLLSEKLFGKDSMRYANTEAHFAEYLINLKEYQEAESLARHAIEVAEHNKRGNHVNASAYSYYLAQILIGKGEYQEAEALLKSAHANYKQIFGSRSQYLDDMQYYLVLTLEAQGKYDEARKFERQNRMWVFR